MTAASSMPALRDVNMLWIGSALGPIEQLSIRSFLRAGHRVNLFTFDHVDHVPEGTTIDSALEYMTRDEYKALRHSKTGSYSLAADLFRYRLMRIDAGFWADADFVCLRPVHCEVENVFGWESDSYLANGFLYLPPDSPVLHDLLNYFDGRRVPPWLSTSRRWKLRLRNAVGQPLSPATLPWGSFGPRALTWLAKHHGVADQGQPRERFYAHPLSNAERVFSKSYQLDAMDSPATLLIHLWNEKIKTIKHTAPEKGSILATLYEQYAVTPDATSTVQTD